MSENKTPIRRINGHALVDEQARSDIEELKVGGGTGGITQETDPTVPSWAKQPNKPTYTAVEVGALPSTTVIPTVPTVLPNPQPIVINGVSYDGSEKKEITIQAADGGIATETDPTVPAWAKNPTKPTYTADEVGALPANASPEDIGAQPAGNYLTAESDPTVPSWAKSANKPKYTASEVGALPDTYEAPVKSVNGKTGAVTLSASDVGALPNTTVIPTVPTALKNPYPITINGVEYDGSEAKTITIQAADGGESVSLDTTLTQYGMAADAGATGNAIAQETAAREQAVNELNEAIDAQGETLTQLNEKNAQQDEAIGKKLDTDKLPAAINTALAQAKESGEFDGKDGAPGAPGEPGYTPQKGIDYFDGAPGEPGTPGQAATFTITGAESLPYGSAPTVTEEAGSTAQARKYKLGIPEGKPGANGEGGGTGSEAVDLLMQVTTEERVAPIMVEFEPKKYRKIVAIARACGHTDNSTSGFLQILGLRESTGKYIKFASPSKLAQETTPHYQRWNVDLVGQLAACAASKSQNGGESWASDNSNGIKPLQVHRISTNELTGIALTAGGGSSYGDREAGSAQTFEVGAYVEVWGVRA